MDHRYIKDENLILNVANGKLNIIDFGSGTFRQNAPYEEFDGKIQTIQNTKLLYYDFRHPGILPSRVDSEQEILWREAYGVVPGNPSLSPGVWRHSFRE